MIGAGGGVVSAGVIAAAIYETDTAVSWDVEYPHGGCIVV